MREKNRKKYVWLFCSSPIFAVLLLALLVSKRWLDASGYSSGDVVNITDTVIISVETQDISEKGSVEEQGLSEKTSTESEYIIQSEMTTTDGGKVTEEVYATKTTTEHSEISVNDSDNTFSEDVYTSEEIENVSIQETEETEHLHSFETVVSCVYHPEEGHYEEVCLSEGYNENIYESYDKYCYQCGVVMDGWDFSQILDHSAIHGSFGTYSKLVDTVWHEPVYETVWVVDKYAYEEEVMTEKCIVCGYVK